MTVVEFSSVGMSFGQNVLLEDANVVIERGRSYGLAGPNGSGKSVVLKLMCGFLSPTRGKVTIDPIYLSSGRTFPDRFGVTIDDPAYIGGLSGLQNLQALASIRKRATNRELADALTRLGLEPASRVPVRRYSQGMRKKLALAQAFIEEPEVLVLDEPFNALDEQSSVRVRDLISEMRASGKTFVITSHNPIDLDKLTDMVLEIRNRQISCRSR